AHLADHDHLGVLPQQAAQPAGEVELRPRPDLRLADPLDYLLDRVFNGDDVPAPALAAHQVAQAGVNGRGLAAAAGAGEQDRTVALAQEVRQTGQHIGRKPQLLQVQGLAGGLEDADHDFFAVDRRKRAHAQVGAELAHRLPDATLLGDVDAV